MSESSKCRVEGNYLKGGREGVIIYEASNNIITRNIITSHKIGIMFYNSTDNNISENLIKDNQVGIEVYNSYQNYVYHNDFINNINQTISKSSENFWDDGYPSGGNYWSDHVGKDLYLSLIHI